MMIRHLLAAIGVGLLAGCSQAPVSADPAAVEAEVAALLDEWAVSLSEGRLDDFKALYANADGFLWVERGQFLYTSADAIGQGVDQIAASGAVVTNALSDVDIVPMGADFAAFSATVQSTITADTFSVDFGGVMTGIAIREDAKWKLYRGHLSEPSS